MKKAMVLALSIMMCFGGGLFAATLGDINQDGKITTREAVYALQVAAGIRSTLPTTNGEITLENRYTNDAINSVLLSVPEGKTFVLTDMIALGFVPDNNWCQIYNKIYEEGDQPKLDFWRLDYRLSLHLNSGIPFTSGKVVYFRAGRGGLRVMISGYMVQN